MPAAPYIQANVNGTIQPAHLPALAPLNRGFLYGDAIYEVWRTYKGHLFTWEEHWARLERSAASLQLALPFTPEQMLVEIRRTTAAYRAATQFDGELYVRLQVSRGGGPIGLDPALADATDFTLLVQPLPLLSDEQARKGYALSLATGLHRNSPATLDPAWKTGNYLNNILCLREAKSRGADEVVMTNLAGEITEAAVCNIAFVRGGEVLTPPLAVGILPGITRSMLLNRVGPAMGIPVREVVIRPGDLRSMDECFLLSSTKDVQPARCIDDIAYRTGDGTVGLKLKEGFVALMEERIRGRADLAV